MLSYEESAYAAHGMFVSDAQVLLSGGGFAGLDQKTLHIKPRPGAKLSEFGWEADGAVVNSTYAFALTCIMAFAMEHNISLPQPLARLLESIPVQYTKHKDSQQRLLQNFVDSAVQRHANRTVQCPIFLAEEFGRCAFQPQFVKPFVKLYQQRMAVTPQLLMPQRMEDCVIRLMTPARTGKDSLKILSGSVVRFTWNDGPWKVGHIMCSYFPVGASLNDSMVDAWRTQNVQTFTGQSLALQVGFGLFEEQHGKTLDLDEMWPTTLIACGLWTNIKESLLPPVMINPKAIDDLERTLKTDEVFRKNMASASAKDPPATTSAVDDVAKWLLSQVPELRRAKESSDLSARSAGASHPNKLLGDQDAAELAGFNYTSSCMLDVQSYRKATEKFTDETNALELQWRDLHGKCTANLKRLHESMQQSDVVFWEPPQRVGLRKNKEWLGKAVAAANSHRRALKTILGVSDDQIFQVSVFSLYALGTVKKNILRAIAAQLPNLKGVAIIFSQSFRKKNETQTCRFHSRWRGRGQ